MSSTTEQIKRLEERIAEFKAMLESIPAVLTTVEVPWLLTGLGTLLIEVGKDEAASKAVGELNAQLKAKETELQQKETELQQKETELQQKETELQKREAEVVQKQLTKFMTQAANNLGATANHLGATANSLRSSSQGLQPTSDKLQSTSTELQSTVTGFGTATESLQLLSTGLRSASRSLQPTSDKLQSTSTKLESTTTDIRSATESLQALSIGLLSPSQGLPPTSDKLQSTSTKLESTTNDIRSAMKDLQLTATGLHSTSDKLQPTSEKLQSTSTELQSTTEIIDSAMKHLNSTAVGLFVTSEGLQEIQSTSKEIQSAMQGLQSSSKTAGSQLEALERLASDLAKTAAADTSALQSQHKQEVDGLKSTISKLETKINAWESGHKERLADFDAKRQAAMTEIEQREQSLARRKEELMSLEIDALQDLRAAGAAAKQVEKRKLTAVGVMNDLERRLEDWKTDVRNGEESLDRYVDAFESARTATHDQIAQAGRLCRELHTDIERFDDQIKSMEVRSGKLPEPRGDVWMTDEEGSIEERVTQPSTGKRAHQASSTSTGASPRKTPAKRVKPTGVTTICSSPTAEKAPPSSLATRWSTSRPQTKSSLSKAPHDFSTAPSWLPRRRPALGPDVFDPPAGQASSSFTRQSFTRQSMSPSRGPGQAQATSSPAATEALAPQTGTQEDLLRLEPESVRESDVGPDVEEEEVPEPSSAQSQIEIPTKVKLIWSQLILGSKLTQKELTDLMQWMQKAEVKTRTGAKASYLLEKCAREERQGRATCFTSCLRGKGGTNFFRGTSEPCNECRKAKIHVPCLRVTLVDDQARTQEDPAKRWIVDKR
ncbi:MAG: hypothetical protein LQ345_002166 [Seirophora villosa]|nr:MAG: hypothetical protein LQ345_002166 [Seirophora villosa]